MNPNKKVGIIAVSFLLVILGVTTSLVFKNQNINEKADACFTNCRRTSGTQVCNCRCYNRCTRSDSHTDPEAVQNWGITPPPSSVPTVAADRNSCTGNVGIWCAGCGGFCLSGSYTGGGCNQAQESKCGEVATYTTTCTEANDGQVVVYSSGDNDYRRCEAGLWVADPNLTLTDVDPDAVPTYLQTIYEDAVLAEQQRLETLQQQAQALADEEQRRSEQEQQQTAAAEQENLAREQSICLADGGTWSKNTCSYEQQREALEAEILRQQQLALEELQARSFAQRRAQEEEQARLDQLAEQQQEARQSTLDRFKGQGLATIPDPQTIIPTTVEHWYQPFVDFLDPESDVFEGTIFENSTVSLGGEKPMVVTPPQVLFSDNPQDRRDYYTGLAYSLGAGAGAAATVLTGAAVIPTVVRIGPQAAITYYLGLPGVAVAEEVADQVDLAVTQIACGNGFTAACDALATAFINNMYAAPTLIANRIDDGLRAIRNIMTPSNPQRAVSIADNYADDLMDVLDAINPPQTQVTATVDVPSIQRQLQEDIDGISFLPSLDSLSGGVNNYGFPTSAADFDTPVSLPNPYIDFLRNAESSAGINVTFGDNINSARFDNFGTITVTDPVINVTEPLRQVDEMMTYLTEPLHNPVNMADNRVDVGANSLSFDGKMGLDPNAPYIPPPPWYQNFANGLNERVNIMFPDTTVISFLERSFPNNPLNALSNIPTTASDTVGQIVTNYFDNGPVGRALFGNPTIELTDSAVPLADNLNTALTVNNLGDIPSTTNPSSPLVRVQNWVTDNVTPSVANIQRRLGLSERSDGIVITPTRTSTTDNFLPSVRNWVDVNVTTLVDDLVSPNSTISNLPSTRNPEIINEINNRFNALTRTELTTNADGLHRSGYFQEGNKDNYLIGNINAIEFLRDRVNVQGDINVLEVGAARGGFLTNVRSQFPNARVSGLSAQDYRSGDNPLLGIDYRIGNAEYISDIFEENSFDFIVSAMTMIHVADPLGDIVQMYDLLKPGGVLIIDAFETPGITNRLDDLLGYLQTHGYDVNIRFRTSIDIRNNVEEIDSIGSFQITKGPETLSLPITYRSLDSNGDVIYNYQEPLVDTIGELVTIEIFNLISPLPIVTDQTIYQNISKAPQSPISQVRNWLTDNVATPVTNLQRTLGLGESTGRLPSPGDLTLEQQFRIAMDQIPGIRTGEHNLADFERINSAYREAGLPLQIRTQITEAVINQELATVLPTRETLLSAFYRSDFAEPALPRTVTDSAGRGNPIDTNVVDVPTQIQNIVGQTPVVSPLTRARNWLDENVTGPVNNIPTRLGLSERAMGTNISSNTPLTIGGISLSPNTGSFWNRVMDLSKYSTLISVPVGVYGVYITDQEFGISDLALNYINQYLNQNGETRSRQATTSDEISFENQTAVEINENQLNRLGFDRLSNQEDTNAPQSRFHTQTDEDLRNMLIETSYGLRPFELIGCGPTAIANILNSLGLAGLSPLEIAGLVAQRDWGYNGTTLFTDGSLLQILSSYGVEYQLFNDSFYTIDRQVSAGDMLLVAGPFRYQGRSVDHISYLEVLEDGTYKLMDNLWINGAICRTAGTHSLRCENNDGEVISLNLENLPTYIIDNDQQLAENTIVAPINGGTRIVNPYERESAPVEFTYFNQRDEAWADMPGYGDATMAEKGCGIMTGAMVTGTDPETYYEAYRAYQRSQGQVDLITNSGTTFNTNMAVLNSIGCETRPIAGSLQEIKEEVENYTNAGTPVWVNAEIYGEGHNAMAVGVDENNNLILNDPWRSENTHVEDRNIVSRTNNPWRFSAIICN